MFELLSPLLIFPYFLWRYKQWVFPEQQLSFNQSKKAIALYLGASISFCYFFHGSDQSYQSLIYALIACLAIGAAIIDLDCLYLPNVFTYPILALAIISRLLSARSNEEMAFVEIVLPGIAFYILFYAINQIHLLLTKKHGLGMGDAKLFAGIAILLGWMPSLSTLCIASIFSVLSSIFFVLFKHKDGVFPMGPSIVLSFLLVVIAQTNKQVSSWPFLQGYL